MCKRGAIKRSERGRVRTRPEELKKLRKEKEGLVEGSTSLKKEASGTRARRRGRRHREVGEKGRFSRAKGMRQTEMPGRLAKNWIG